jgi:hypothetical protein
MQALKGRALASPPTKALLDEIRTHRMGMEATLTAVTILQCNDGSMAMTMKENLKTDLSRAVEEMKNLNRVLATTSRPTGAITTLRVISVEQPSEDLDRKRTAHHTDVNNR